MKVNTRLVVNIYYVCQVCMFCVSVCVCVCEYSPSLLDNRRKTNYFCVSIKERKKSVELDKNICGHGKNNPLCCIPCHYTKTVDVQRGVCFLLADGLFQNNPRPK